jgi:signal transduction histidine kinase/CheY-like chemotaxis protein
MNKLYLSIREKNDRYMHGKHWWDTFDDSGLAKRIKKQHSNIVNNGDLSYSAEYSINKDKTVFIDWKAIIMYSKVYGEKIIIEYGNDVSEKMFLKSQLIHMQKLDSLGTLAGGIAHEFNNILTSIIGYSSFLKNLFHSGSKERGYVDKIQRASLGAAKLTSKLLGFARKGKYVEKLINPNLVVQEIYEIIQKTIHRKIEIKINLLNEIKFILADYDQIFQSIMNLVINASDAMPDGGTLSLSTHLETFYKDTEFKEDGYTVKKGDYYAISVKDTGIGMNKELQKKILEPFFTTKSEGKGTGLGMPMVYGVAKSHKGNLFIDSEPNKGTLITIIIPIAARKGIMAISEDSGIFPIVKIKNNKSILIVDDDVQILDYLENVLTEYGYQIKRALDGQEAYDIINSGINIDLILLDLILPKLDGEAFIKKFNDDSKDIKIIIMTSYPDDTKVEKLKLSGVNYFIFKPFKISNLINLLGNIFKDEDV